LHWFEPGVGAAVPPGHGVHGCVPLSEKEPGSHGRPVHDVEPGGAVVPSGQLWHRSAPKLLENVSAGQSRQVPPARGLNWPGVQGVHGPPFGPEVPAGHGASVVVVTAVHSADPGNDVVPNGHGRHDGVPVSGANVSAGHCEHDVEPGFGASKPAAHSVHGSLPSMLKRPGWHN
jgi:hypothetical protein